MKKSKTSRCHTVNHKWGFGPGVRKDKILSVRQKLIKGKYDLNKRLDVVLDKILEDLITLKR